MTDLLDVNVWLALADENHVHHSAAQNYWLESSAPVIAFCRVTMLGFLRLSTHPKVLSQPLSRQGSWNIYNQYLATEGIEFFDEFRGVDQVFQRITCQPNFSQRRWADAYLAAHALSSGSRIVSFDSDFTTFEGLDFLRLQG